MNRSNFIITSVSLLLVSIGFWFFSILTSVFVFSTSVFSYFSLLPWTYWVGLFLLIIVLGIRLLNKGHLQRQVLFDFLIIFIFVLMLFGTPCFVEQTPRMLDVYSHTTSALVVQTTGNAGPSLISQNVPPSAYEASYPGFFILVSSVLSVTGLSWTVVAQYYPIFLMVLISFLIYAIARKFSSGFSVLAPVLFLGFAWFEEFHLSPDSFALVLYLIAWLIFIQFLERKKSTLDRKIIIPLLIVFFAISVSHAGGPIFILLNAIVFLAFGFFSLRFRNQFSRKSIFNLFLILLLFFLAWNLYAASSSFSGITSSFVSSLGSLSSSAITARTSLLSSGYSFVGLLREAEIGLINLIGLVCGVLLLRAKNYRKTGILLLTWWLSCWGFALYSFGSAGSYIERPALFSLIPLALMVPLFLSTVKNPLRIKLFAIIALILVGASCFLLPITRNANDVFETPPVASMSAANFAIEKTSQQIIVGGNNLFVSVIYAGPNLSLEGLYNQLDGKNLPYYYLFDSTYIMQNDSLIIFDQPAYAYSISYGYPSEYQQIQNFSNSEFSCIYSNAEATIYINRLASFNATSEMGG